MPRDKGSSVRVPAERLDELMDRVGELVIAQARLTQLAHARTDFGIKAIAEEIERLASGLRDTTMGIRMVPIGSLFGRFRRLVHDLSRDLDKPVELVTSGEDTELDKTVIERLADPMVHLIRNAIDHGIETQAGRAGTSKPSVGRIELLAEHVGAQVLITVRDDGRGLDVVKIRAKAEDQGLIQPGCVMSDQDLYQLLFYPGFSTAQSISSLSGRGVGMDVVKRTIESLRGHDRAGHDARAGLVRGAPAPADAGHHRRPSDPGRGGALCHPALGDRGVRRAARPPGPSLAFPILSRHPWRPRAVSSSARPLRRRRQTGRAPEGHHHLGRRHAGSVSWPIRSSGAIRR